MPQSLLCVVRGHGDSWEALCLDFDLAVQGRSLDEVIGHLTKAVVGYIESASAEQEPTKTELLGRRAPLGTRLMWKWRVVLWTIFGKQQSGDSTFGFPIPCPV
jgi:hypothetical protein